MTEQLNCTVVTYSLHISKFLTSQMGEEKSLMTIFFCSVFSDFFTKYLFTLFVYLFSCAES